ncbi:MAG TPA: hypothetical protein VNK67_12605 [Burkholderiales bacterium]|nr:hypothetical protein [Burkholderiales bacterium]
MKRAFLFSTALLAACAAPLPQQPPAGMPAQVPAPEVRAGDTWTYRVRDAYTGLPRGEQSYRVAEVAAQRVKVIAELEGAAREEQLYDRHWNWLRRPATNLQSFEYSPAYPAFDFPLAAGKRWSAQVIATDPADGRRFPVSIHAQVLGWERVKVPAGEFDALKVKRQVFFDYWVLGVRGRSEIVEYDWYAPAVKQVVRREASSMYLSYLYGGAGRAGLLLVSKEDDGGPRFVRDDWLVAELVSYTVR